jgi:hypothetical protein
VRAAVRASFKSLYLKRHQINSKLKLCSRALQIQP